MFSKGSPTPVFPGMGMSFFRDPIRTVRINEMIGNELMVEESSQKSLREVAPRGKSDRRQRLTPILSKHTIFGKRKDFRRDEDSKQYIYVDRYGMGLFVMLMAILVLGTADALLTLYHVHVNDAVELNPVMNFFLGVSPEAFFHVKYVVTALCLLVLCLHKNVPLVKYVLGSVFVLYLIIVFNHIFMFFLVA